ncbi:MAG: ribosome recycling factor [Candidatus Omnitrophica bacterium]|nr:ribosome recycling factor [Candidatus Omnitrophota bacterium]
MLPLQKHLHETEEKMKKTVDATVRDFQEVRTGRANPGLVEGIMVEYYGTNTPLKQLASISVPEPRLIAIHPWDPSSVPLIEKAILKSQLGINPINDGKIIRIAIPSLTKERCDELKKVLHKIAEQGRVSIRTVRRDGIDTIKKMEDSKEIPEDARFKGQEEVQKLTDKYSKKIEGLLADKEKELTVI